MQIFPLNLKQTKGLATICLTQAWKLEFIHVWAVVLSVVSPLLELNSGSLYCQRYTEWRNYTCHTCCFNSLYT